MRIVIINASLKKKDSISELLIDRMLPFLKENEYGILNVSAPMERRMQKSILKAAEAIVIVTPVSYGGLPSSLTALLSGMEMHALRRNIPVCSVIHGEQTDPESLKHAQNMLKIWSDKCHLHLCMNLLISGSDQMRWWKNVPTGNQIMKKTDHALTELADALYGNEKEDICLSAGSLFVYKRSMEHYWKKELSVSGLKKSDAAARLNENSFTNR